MNHAPTLVLIHDVQLLFDEIVDHAQARVATAGARAWAQLVLFDFEMVRCTGEDLNLHALRRRNLNPLRMPISPPVRRCFLMLAGAPARTQAIPLYLARAVPPPPPLFGKGCSRRSLEDRNMR